MACASSASTVAPQTDVPKKYFEYHLCNIQWIKESEESLTWQKGVVNAKWQTSQSYMS